MIAVYVIWKSIMIHFAYRDRRDRDRRREQAMRATSQPKRYISQPDTPQPDPGLGAEARGWDQIRGCWVAYDRSRHLWLRSTGRGYVPERPDGDFSDDWWS